MKKLLFSLLIGITSLAYSQVPQGINYQSVVRATSGSVLPNTVVTVEFKLYNGLSATLVYHETHSTTTNSFGMVNLIIGQGTPLSGSFNSIPWSTTNGIGYEVLVNSNLVGSKQLFMSVPYALHAGSAPAPVVSFTNNILSVGGNTTSITSGTTYTAGNGISISGGIISNTLVPITPTITGGNNITINPTTPSNSYTVSAPSYSLSQSGNNIDLLQNGTSIGTATLPVVSSYSAGSGISIVGNVISNTLTPVTPTLSVTGNSISINPGNTQALPNYSLTQSGANIDLTQNGASIATVTLTAATSTSLSAGSSNIILNQSGNAYTITPVTPTFTNSGPTTISGSYPNYTVNSVASPTTSLVAGNLNLTLFPSGNTYTLDVKSYSLTANSNTLMLSNGASITTATVPSSPSYLGTPNNISIISNSINLVPTGVITGVYGANATNAVPTYSVDNFGRLISSGQYTTTLSGDVLGAANTTTVTRLQTRPVSNTAPTANQVLTWNGSAWTPSSTVVPVLSYTGSATAGTLQSGAQTVTIPNYTLSNTSNTITLNNGTANSTAIIPVPTLSLTGSILQSGPITNTINLSSVPGLWTAPTATSVVTTNSISLVGIGTNNPTYKLDVYGTGSVPATIHGYNSGATASSTGVFGENPNNGIGVYGQSGSGAGVWGKSTTGAGIYGESTNGDGGKFILSSNTTTANAVNAQTNGSGVALFAKSYNAIPLAAKFEGSAEIFHSATVLNPHLNIASASGSYGIIKFSNSGQSSYFTHDVINNGSGINEAYSISHYNGINTKQVFLINGQRMAYINALNYPLATFHVMTSTATANGGIASEGFAQAGQLNIIRNNNAGAGARTSVFGGDEIGKINFAAFDGSNYGDGAKIYAKSTENVTGSNKGTELIFAAVPTGTNSNKDAFKINGAGNLEIISGLRIPLGAVSGHVLTSDASGNASWQTITAPVAAWTSTLGNTYLVNSGDKVGIGTNTPTAKLQVENTLAGDRSMYLYQAPSTTDEALFIDNRGTQQAAIIENNNSSNTNVALLATSNGIGGAIRAQNTSTANTTDVLNVSQVGQGNASYFIVNNSGNFAKAIEAQHNGNGVAIGAANSGFGRAGEFVIQNAANNSSALYATTNGGGSAMSATNFGSGTAGIISISSSTNTSTSLEVNSAGTGTSLFAVNTNASVLAYAGNFDGGLIVKGKTSASADYAFKVSSSISEVFGIKNNGNIGVNVLNPIYKVHVNSSNTVATLYSENIVTGSFPNAHGISGKVASSNTNTLAAGVFGNNAGAGPSIFGSKAATDISGNAGRFEILNTGNTADGIFTQTNGRGAAIHAVNGPTVTGSSNVALLLENGHMKSVGTTPTFTLNALASGTGVIGTDMVGKLSFTVLLSAILSNTDVITVKFDKPYSTVPNIIIIPNNGSSYAVNAYVNAASVNGFSLRFANNSGISTTYSFNYLVIE